VAGKPIERIQLLCGDADKTTTEIYIKARRTETAARNLSNIQQSIRRSSPVEIEETD
jgi:hypothetical protein